MDYARKRYWRSRGVLKCGTVLQILISLRQRVAQPASVLAVAALRMLQKALWIFSFFC